ncbi:hypothetical protein HPB48_011665 [Haemaphysalis longicornis]|uniref:Uncharacterized protein n=1 Tax=Haemaphysalis longicornis TaxID=44386 RepID=A0A9J6G0N0_HAELO|nr:hypothetical protein HPB48_011665 [Haemaphysalis longicornis]
MEILAVGTPESAVEGCCKLRQPFDRFVAAASCVPVQRVDELLTRAQGITRSHEKKPVLSPTRVPGAYRVPRSAKSVGSQSGQQGLFVHNVRLDVLRHFCGGAVVSLVIVFMTP